MLLILSFIFLSLPLIRRNAKKEKLNQKERNSGLPTCGLLCNALKINSHNISQNLLKTILIIKFFSLFYQIIKA